MAGLAIQAIQATTGLDHLPIGPWGGPGVLVAYAGIFMFLFLAAVVLETRDV